ncbi:MAG: cytochrome P460 family protein [Alphaproteobacteria bacterium]|uniref:Cytochrome P460 family protein n=1 Tax=Candidatus Nitrobium versatile TaxID=2884831 RepID=A0A953JCA0_9BACT|nr:cytochrome P460 family protein [Candidatus Nitrobium versatile]
MPGADAQKLGEYILRGSPYTQWKMWPGKGRFYKGTEPHGVLLTTYVNDTAYSSIRSGRGVLSDGSLIVKENYTPEKTLTSLTVMYKVKGYSPKAGNWFWAKYTPEGKAETAGDLEMCIQCHGKNKENDYIMTERLKK